MLKIQLKVLYKLPDIGADFIFYPRYIVTTRFRFKIVDFARQPHLKHNSGGET